METLEQKAAANGGVFQIDLDAGPDSEWCVIMVSPAFIEKLREIASRKGLSPDDVLVAAVDEYAKKE